VWLVGQADRGGLSNPSAGRRIQQALSKEPIMRLPCICLLVGLTPLIAAQRPPAFSLRAQPGPNAVGLRVIQQYDYSRVFGASLDALGRPDAGERARPLQTLVWYPALKNSAHPMTVGEYLDLGATETSFVDPKPLVGPGAWFMDGTKRSRPERTWAARDAPLAQGKFPVVIYAPSFSSWSWENLDLCEYLASHGYVVVSSPGMGVGRQSTHDIAGVNAQARDISFLIGYAQSLPDTELSEVGVVGFSWGGLANLFAASRDSRIHALVALDGSMRYFPGLVQHAGDIAPERMTLPLLFFKGQSSIEDQARLEETFKSSGPSVLNAWIHGDLITVQMLGLTHPEFSSVSQRNERFWQYDFPHLQEGDYGREDGMVGYSWVARYTLEFLDAYLKHDTRGLSFLRQDPAQNGVPAHVMAVSFRVAQPLSASFDAFKAEVGRRGFDRTAQIYAQMQKAQPDFKLDSQDIAAWGYELLSGRNLREALEIMRFYTTLDGSGFAYLSLGEVYRESGQIAPAIDCYRKALGADPGSVMAKQRLEELEAAGGTPR
jgi:hypothetical protein